MRLNAKKTVSLVVDTRRKPEDHIISVDSTPIPKVNSVKLLGIIINNNLTWDDHIKYITIKAASRLNYLRKLKALGFQKEELLIAYCSFIRPVLEYNSTVWGPGLSIDQASAVEKIQRRAVSSIVNKKVNETSYDDQLSKLRLDTLRKRRELALTRLGASILQNPRLRKMLPEFNKNTNARSLRQMNLLVPPSTSRKRYKFSAIPAMVELINAEFRLKKSFMGKQYLHNESDDDFYNHY